MRSSRVLRYEAPGRLRLETVEMPEPAPGDALVRMLSCGICGTDLHIFEEGWHATPGMTLGHEFSAEVVAAPEVAGVDAGDRVVVNPTLSCGRCAACVAGQQHLCHERRGVIGITEGGAFADYVLVPQARLGQELLPIPAGVSDEAAALTEPLAVGLHAVELSDVKPEDHVVVYGAGTIGLCVTRWLAVEGVQGIVVVDPLQIRRQAAMVQGATAALDPFDDLYSAALAAELTDASRPGKADVVIDCAGARAVLDGALSIVRPGGALTLAAVLIGDDSLSNNRILLKEVTVRGAMSYNGPEFERALGHVAEWGSDVESLVSHRFTLAEAIAGFHAQIDRETSLKVMIATEGAGGG
jgi:2-desacetyl-2-hydroxyethyl bacteriochlorophyllide A dehydrogenase